VAAFFSHPAVLGVEASQERVRLLRVPGNATPARAEAGRQEFVYVNSECRLVHETAGRNYCLVKQVAEEG
jgi:hypothetical protein